MPVITVTPQASGPPGSKATVQALNVGQHVEIRWNDLQGPLLGTASGPTFSVPVDVPDTPAGLYTIIVLDRSTDGSVGNTARAEFLVTGPGAAAATAAPTAARVTVAPATTATSSGGGGTSPAVTVLVAAVVAAAVALGASAVARRRGAETAAPAA